MTSLFRLTQATAVLSSLKHQLLREDPTLADDEALLRDTLEGITPEELTPETVRADLERAIRALLAAEGMEEQAKVQIDRLKGRADRYGRRAEKIRGAVVAAMDVLNEAKIEMPEATLTMGRSKGKVVVTDDSLIPAAYWEPQPATLSKKLLSDALKAGADVPGAMLDNSSPTLTVRKN